MLFSKPTGSGIFLDRYYGESTLRSMYHLRRATACVKRVPNEIKRINPVIRRVNRNENSKSFSFLPWCRGCIFDRIQHVHGVIYILKYLCSKKRECVCSWLKLVLVKIT